MAWYLVKHRENIDFTVFRFWIFFATNLYIISSLYLRQECIKILHSVCYRHVFCFQNLFAISLYLNSTFCLWQACFQLHIFFSLQASAWLLHSVCDIPEIISHSLLNTPVFRFSFCSHRLCESLDFSFSSFFATSLYSSPVLCDTPVSSFHI